MKYPDFLVAIACYFLISVNQSAISQTLPVSIRTYGLAVPTQQVVLRSAVDGLVHQVRATEGQLVKKGDVVVQLECRPAKARRKIAKLAAEGTGLLQAATAELETARANYKRMQSLYRQSASSGQNFDEAELRLRRAQADLKIEHERLEASRARFELAEAELERFFLRAPFEGVVVQVLTSKGASVSKSKDLVQIVSLDKFRVDLFLPVTQANRLEVGDAVPLQVTSPFRKSLEATLLFRSPLIEAATGTTRVLLEIDNREAQMPSGFTVSLMDDDAT